jgi:lysophospholipase L1-like esterase
MTRKILVAIAILAAVAIGSRILGPSPAPLNIHPARATIVCFGDSLTAGTGAPEGASYPDQLGQLLGRSVVNAGVPGDTTTTALERLDRDVLSHDPGVVCITLGGNDMMQRSPRDEAFQNLDTIVERLQAAGALVLVAGVEPPMVGSAWDDGYRELCARRRCLLVPDVLDGLWGHSDLMSDTIHPNQEGYAKVARRIAKELRPAL